MLGVVGSFSNPILRSTHFEVGELKDHRRFRDRRQKNYWIQSRPVSEIGEDLGLADHTFQCMTRPGIQYLWQYAFEEVPFKISYDAFSLRV